ncbi:MAG: GNAT family N-acetyltransferase [Xanthomonadaceae bacterium]|nr:GNAT family N-acetyltransferase [Xanthomonadaceae bacterium]
MSDELRIERLYGAAIAQQLPGIAQLRIQVFREFPYLYEGSEDYERKYLQTYIDSPDSLFVLVFDGERLVGASSGLPLSDEVDDLRRPFEQQGEPVERIFYCGESVLLPEYRGRGIGVRFFEEREAHARRLGRFEKICFCAVERPADHPRRPADYLPLDGFWQRRGYQKRSDLRTTFVWQDLDETAESPKPMVFWMKSL